MADSIHYRGIPLSIDRGKWPLQNFLYRDSCRWSRPVEVICLFTSAGAVQSIYSKGAYHVYHKGKGGVGIAPLNAPPSDSLASVTCFIAHCRDNTSTHTHTLQTHYWFCYTPRIVPCMWIGVGGGGMTSKHLFIQNRTTITDRRIDSTHVYIVEPMSLVRVTGAVERGSLQEPRWGAIYRSMKFLSKTKSQH